MELSDLVGRILAAIYVDGAAVALRTESTVFRIVTASRQSALQACLHMQNLIGRRVLSIDHKIFATPEGVRVHLTIKTSGGPASFAWYARRFGAELHWLATEENDARSMLHK